MGGGADGPPTKEEPLLWARWGVTGLVGLAGDTGGFGSPAAPGAMDGFLPVVQILSAKPGRELHEAQTKGNLMYWRNSSSTGPYVFRH